MNIKAFLSAFMAAMLLALLATAAVGQSGQEFVANIPFNFTVCRDQLPAGAYKVRPISRANPRIMLISTADNRPVEIICTHDVQGEKLSATGKLIFNRYGEQYFLSELWMQGERTGLQLPKTDQEEALLRELKGSRKRGKVTIKVIEIKQ